MNTTEVVQLCREAEAAFSSQAAHVTRWREACEFCLPWKAQNIALPGAAPTPYTPNPKLQNSVASQSALTLVRGIKSQMTPQAREWIQWGPAPEVDNDPTRQWFLRCTRRALPHLEAGGFYNALTEALFDAVASGNAPMRVEAGTRTALRFTSLDIGSYAMSEDGDGKIRNIWQRMTRTVAEAAAEWGEESLPQTLREMPQDRRLTTHEVFLIYIGERKEVTATAGPLSMPFAVVTIHEKTKHVVNEGGVMEWPVPVLRWLECSGPSVWGVGPGEMALLDSRGVNYLDLKMGEAVGKLVDPPLAAMDNVTGALDLREGGVSIISDLANAPRQIYEVGDVRFLDGFLTKKEAQLERFFHAPLFAAFLNETRQITAEEARLKHGEKLDQFLETFSRIVTWLNEILERVFMILLRGGYFEPPPPEAYLPSASGDQFLYPKLTHQSPMAMAMNSMAGNQIRGFLADMLPVAQVRPEVLDHIDFGKAVRIMGQESAALAEIILPLREVQALQQQRQQQQLAMMAAQSAMKAAEKGGLSAQAAA